MSEMLTAGYANIDNVIAKARSRIANGYVEGEDAAQLETEIATTQMYREENPTVTFGLRIETQEAPNAGDRVNVLLHKKKTIVQRTLGPKLLFDGFGHLFAKDPVEEQQLREAAIAARAG